VPCIVWAPGYLPAGRRVSSIVSGVDWLPTFRAMAGLPPLEGMTLDGRDISGVLKSGAPSPHEAIILFDNEDPIGVRTQGWKYVESAYYRGLKLPMALLGYEQLYDVKADPSENYSVAATYPEIAKALKDRLAAAKAEFAPFKHKDIPPVFKALRAQVEHLQD
jgi:arylsulfatase A-like enzyme